MKRLVYYTNTALSVRRDNLTSKAIKSFLQLACSSSRLTSMVFECSIYLDRCENKKKWFYPGNSQNQSNNETFLNN